MADYFKDKVIAITGGASGMGLATVKHMCSLGAKVSIADVQEKLLQQVKTEIEGKGGVCITFATDIQDEAQVSDWISNTVSTFGKLDGVVNCAAVIGNDVLLKATEDITTADSPPQTRRCNCEFCKCVWAARLRKEWCLLRLETRCYWPIEVRGKRVGPKRHQAEHHRSVSVYYFHCKCISLTVSESVVVPSICQ